MKDQDYLDERDRIKQRYDDEISILCKRYVNANKRFKKGDIVKNPSGIIIQVEKVMYRYEPVASDVPTIYYHGLELTKKLQLRKDKSVRTFSDKKFDLVKVK